MVFMNLFIGMFLNLTVISFLTEFLMAIILGVGFRLQFFLGQSLARIKSLTGEPSMYAFTVLPFFIMSVHYKKTFLSFLLLITLFLSFSTTAYLGILAYIML
jgi:hypothetical protein